jgi:hypothetical protein
MIDMLMRSSKPSGLVTKDGFQTTDLFPHGKCSKKTELPNHKMVRNVGLEPTVFYLASKCVTGYTYSAYRGFRLSATMDCPVTLPSYFYPSNQVNPFGLKLARFLSAFYH